MGKVSKYELLPLSKLGIDRFQVRKTNVGQGLDELAAMRESGRLANALVVAYGDHNAGFNGAVKRSLAKLSPEFAFQSRTNK